MRIVLAIFVLAFVAIAVAKPSLRSKPMWKAPMNQAKLRSFHRQTQELKHNPSKANYRELKFLLGSLLKSANSFKRDGGESSEDSFEDFCAEVPYEPCNPDSEESEFLECIEQKEDDIGSFLVSVYEEATGDELLTADLYEKFDQAFERESCPILKFFEIQEVIDETVDRFYDGIGDAPLSDDTWNAVNDNVCRFYLNREDAFHGVMKHECGGTRK